MPAGRHNSRLKGANILRRTVTLSDLPSNHLIFRPIPCRPPLVYSADDEISPQISVRARDDAGRDRIRALLTIQFEYPLGYHYFITVRMRRES